MKGAVGSLLLSGGLGEFEKLFVGDVLRLLRVGSTELVELGFYIEGNRHSDFLTL